MFLLDCVFLILSRPSGFQTVEVDKEEFMIQQTTEESKNVISLMDADTTIRLE